MKLRISRSHGYHKISRPTKGITQQITLPDWSRYNLNIPSKLTYKFHTPESIQIRILTTLFFSYLIDRDFSMAFQMTLINQFYAVHFYNLIYGHSPHVPVTLSYRIGVTLAFCQSFDDNYITEISYNLNSIYGISLLSRDMSWYDDHPELWELLPMIEVSTFEGCQASYQTQIFHTGPYAGDIVMATGKYNNRVFETDKIEHPVFILQVCDAADVLMFTESYSIPDSYRKLSMLLTYVYGPNTATYCMVKPEREHRNPFITNSNKLIKI